MTMIHPCPFNPCGDWSTKCKPSFELRTWNSVRNSVFLGSAKFHQCHQHTARRDPSKYDSVTLVPQPKQESPECHWQACGFSCWSWWQYFELSGDVIVNYQRGLTCSSFIFAPCTTEATLNTELFKNHGDKCLLFQKNFVQESGTCRKTSISYLEFPFSMKNCNSEKMGCAQRTGAYKELQGETRSKFLTPNLVLFLLCYSPSLGHSPKQIEFVSKGSFALWSVISIGKLRNTAGTGLHFKDYFTLSPIICLWATWYNKDGWTW